jgi:gamma-glutamylcyclotransferase (GGCT)/AIG2-like uncharacterized protein YtfP
MPDPVHLFVYGTLRPGEVRWHHLRPYVVDDGWPDRVAGLLYDTGLDYPAAVFTRDGTGDGTVSGQTFELEESTMAECLARLDDEEDTVDGLYRRVVVVTEAGVQAWAYAYGDGLELTPIPSGDWLRR